MGLDFNFGDARFSYGGFHRYRCKLALEIGIILEFMEGFWRLDIRHDTPNLMGREKLDIDFLPKEPIKRDNIKDDIKIFLYHSDCDGRLTPSQCKKIIPRLKKITEKWEGLEKEETDGLIKSMKEAIKRNKRLLFI